MSMSSNERERRRRAVGEAASKKVAEAHIGPPDANELAHNPVAILEFGDGKNEETLIQLTARDSSFCMLILKPSNFVEEDAYKLAATVHMTTTEAVMLVSALQHKIASELEYAKRKDPNARRFGETSDGMEILRRRYLDGDPEMQQLLAEEYEFAMNDLRKMREENQHE